MKGGQRRSSELPASPNFYRPYRPNLFPPGRIVFAARDERVSETNGGWVSRWVAFTHLVSGKIQRFGNVHDELGSQLRRASLG